MRRLQLFLKEVSANPLIGSLVLLSIIFSAFLTACVLAAGLGAERYIDSRFARALPPNHIQVSPKKPMVMSFLPFQNKRKNAGMIDSKALASFRKLPGVKKIHPLAASEIPLQALIGIFGLNYRTDLVVIGTTSDFLGNDLKTTAARRAWNSWKPGKPIPAMIPQILLDAYNNSMAEPNGLPRITEEFAIGKGLQIIFGKSSIKTLPNFTSQNTSIVGITGKISQICIVIPLSSLEYFQKKLRGSSKPQTYITVYLETDNHDGYLKAVKALKKTGYRVETDRSLSEKMLELKEFIKTAARAIMIVLLAFSMLSVGFSTLIATLDRLEYYRLLRILGASKVTIAASLFFKFVLIGFAGTTIGIIVFFKLPLDSLIKSALPGFSLQGYLGKTLYKPLIFWGSLLPGLASIPALFRLYTKGLTED